MDSAFGLPLGFVYIQIGLAGVVLVVIACLASLVIWLGRGAILKALPSAFVVLAMPPMLLGIIPGAEAVAVPLALGAAFIAFVMHVKALGTEQSSTADKIVAGALGLGLAAIVMAFTLGSLTASG